LIEREYGIKVSKWTAGRYLKAWGMSAQKPVRRAYERKDEQIERWLNEDYPGIAKEAKQEGAIIYWGDEMGLRSDHVSGTSFALKGETPVVWATGQRFGCNMISAITNRGELSFMVFEGTFKNATFIEFMVSVSGSRLESRLPECEGDAFVRTRAMRWKTRTLRLQRRWVHVAHGKGKRSGAKWSPPGKRAVSALGGFAENRVWR
jgi:hypothetical protein